LDIKITSRPNGGFGVHRKCFLRNCTTSVKKNELKPWLNESWIIPPTANAEFVCQRSEVLELYTLEYAPDYPLVCFDEISKQLISEIATPIEAKPGQIERFGVMPT
jgi:hypothetical protein